MRPVIRGRVGTRDVGAAKLFLVLLCGFDFLGAARAEEAQVGDAALGAYLSSECVTCHQASGQQVGGVPAIIGWPHDQFIAVMKGYRAGLRDNPVMHNVASRLSDDDIAALAAHFGGIVAAAK
jgi:cytochrome c553